MKAQSFNLTPRRTWIIVFTVITALVHLYLSLSSQPVDIVFMLNFFGYLALLAAFILPLPVIKNYHGLVRWAFLVFTAITVIAWVVMTGFQSYWFAYPDKLIEVALIALLWLEKD